MIFLLMYHISVVSSLLSGSAFTSMQKDGPCFQSVDFGFNSDTSVAQMMKMNFILEKIMSLDKAILFINSVSHLASGFIVKLKYLKVPTCFILSPLHRMLHTRMSDCFEMTMHSVFFVFTFYTSDCYKDILQFFFQVGNYMV